MVIQKHWASQKGIEFKLIFESTKKMVRCDESRVKQVLLGLQTNAIKFTEKGHVRIFAGIDESSNQLKISVEDTGAGIKEEDKDKLFKLFGFLEETRSMNTKGIGLGLVIADQIVSQFDGKITFTSKYGVGSRFTFTMDIGKQ